MNTQSTRRAFNLSGEVVPNWRCLLILKRKHGGCGDHGRILKTRRKKGGEEEDLRKPGPVSLTSTRTRAQTEMQGIPFKDKKQLLLREFVECPSLEIFKPWMDTIMSNLLWLTLLWAGWLGSMLSREREDSKCDIFCSCLLDFLFMTSVTYLGSKKMTFSSLTLACKVVPCNQHFHKSNNYWMIYCCPNTSLLLVFNWESNYFNSFIELQMG